MISNIVVSRNEQMGIEVRSVLVDGQVWFVAKDVCEALGLSNVTMAVEKLDDDEKGLSSINTRGGSQKLTVINKSGLYSLVLSSRKQEAKVFRKWITNVVIPSIEEKGYYAVNESVVPFDSDTLLLQFMENTKKMIEDKRQLTIERDNAIKTKAQISDTKTATALGKLGGTVKALNKANEKVEMLQETLKETLKEKDNTVLGFALLHNFQITRTDTILYGKALSKLCKDKGIEIKSIMVQNEKYPCNVYPSEILISYFQALGYNV